ncbi:MAG: type II toxin-antitoxin system PemK/MazF family toxin [Nitrospirae bacterium]|nr:type II toxin-antitoxin system PemK/MazF family toxin [Nitrospirota bacterium]
MKIKKGYVCIADLNPRIGTEPGKVRPVVVVQTDLLNGIHPSTIICPITTQVQPKARFLRVHLKAGEGGLQKLSDILVDQIRAVDNQRLLSIMGEISSKSLKHLMDNIHTVLA